MPQLLMDRLGATTRLPEPSNEHAKRIETRLDMDRLDMDTVACSQLSLGLGWTGGETTEKKRGAMLTAERGETT